jgi:hypothetical protein
MKRLLFAIITLVFVSCGDIGQKNQDDTLTTDDEKDIVEQEEVELPSVDLKIENLIGIWKLAGIGASATGSGIPPAEGEILMQINEDNNMAIATEGLEELKLNMAGIPSPFVLEGNNVCSEDLLFKLQFKKRCTEVVKVDSNEIVFAIDLNNPGALMYKRYTRVK